MKRTPRQPVQHHGDQDPYGPETPNYMLLNEAHRAMKTHRTTPPKAKSTPVGKSQPNETSSNTPSGA